MKALKKFKSLILKLSILVLNLNFDIFFFKKKKILVYDTETSRYYENFFDKKKTYFHSNRLYSVNSKINFFLFIWALINYFFNKKLFLSQIYSLCVIRKIKPKIIITFTDYDYFIYDLKKKFPKIKFIIFQHQLRSKNFLKKKYKILKKEKIYIDYVCIFGKSLKKYYSLFLKTKYKIIGSIRNNFKKKNNKKNNKELVIISSFRPSFYSNYFNDKNLDFYNKSLVWIMSYCKINKIKLFILPWSTLHDYNKNYLELEKKYYKRVLGNNGFKIMKKNKFADSYNLSSKFNYFISFNSTMAYELLSRNYRVAILRKAEPKRIKKKSNLDTKINFIDSLTAIKLKGYFWTSYFTKKEIFRVLKNIYRLNNKKNYFIKKNYISQFMIHDYKCQKNKTFLKNIGLRFN